ncbi:hypothetical protein [Pseudomonas mosselii]|uniref:hypothetical protein n=1 Tax=Pseudomonas mosselii TaxID=78327 RepID=UPI0021D8C96D|nr:hypothetical protein [Pseudomonas mosselii]MCU9528666.1 hypothetical protein [Pseudomonas mosselii]MCU9535067.1 hypothetical protein [Pseudomonas mosselii]MCU9541464.1 hypothetical protein [Pseudomonas mosselii]MCU9546802.1 hypothetical protein [Pseudomonas mosselii]
MQPHQQVLAVGILWLVTLIVAPYLFTKARSRAFSRGVEIGKEHHRADLKLQLKTLREELDEARVQTEADQRKHHLGVASLKRTITELEERIMSYTGMPVTRADYDLMINAVETLALAEKTWKVVQGTEPWCKRALQQQQDIQALAVRVHHQLRSTPASAATAGAAA